MAKMPGGTLALACLRVETIRVSVNFDFVMEPSSWENMPESSTFVMSRDQRSLRGFAVAKRPDTDSATPKIPLILFFALATSQPASFSPKLRYRVANSGP
jgi:hypothetical protein